MGQGVSRKPSASRQIVFSVGAVSWRGMLDGTPIACAIGEQLPITATVNRWGDEIYFDVPVTLRNHAPTLDVSVGDIAYWPEGPCLCIFFGKTPASLREEPRPASAVTIVGRTDAPVELLRSITEGTSITIRHAGSTQNSSV